MKIGLIGCGAIGRTIAKYIVEGKAGENEIIAICDIDITNLDRLKTDLKKSDLQLTTNPYELIENNKIDLIIEASNQTVIRNISEKVVNAGKNILIMSVGALTDNDLLTRLQKKAREKNVRIYVPSGAICGLDGIKAATMEKIEKIELTTTKNPKSLEGAPYILDNKIDLSGLVEPLVIFEGNAREAAKGFPQNINVAVALSLAGIGLNRTKIRIIADPSASKTKHEIVAKGEFGDLYTVVNNFLHPENPKTSYIAALSAIRVINKMEETIQIGT